MATMTASAQRESAKHHYNAMLAACPTRQLLDMISDKWVCLVLADLVTGPQRHTSSDARSPASVKRCSPRPYADLNATEWSNAPSPPASRSESTTS